MATAAVMAILCCSVASSDSIARQMDERVQRLRRPSGFRRWQANVLQNHRAVLHRHIPLECPRTAGAGDCARHVSAPARLRDVAPRPFVSRGAWATCPRKARGAILRVFGCRVALQIDLLTIVVNAR